MRWLIAVVLLIPWMGCSHRQVASATIASTRSGGTAKPPAPAPPPKPDPTATLPQSPPPSPPKTAAKKSRPHAPAVDGVAAGGAMWGSYTRSVTIAPRVSSLTWNAWAADPGAPFDPAPHLHPDTDYELTLDLSGISYDLLDGGRSRSVGPGFDRQMQDWSKDAARQNAVFKVLLLPDPAYFDNPVKRVDTLQFKLSRLNEGSALLTDLDVAKGPLAVLRTTPEPSFRLGHVSFKIHTGQLQGTGAIGLSIWADGRRPVDELVVTYCISSDDAGTTLCKASTRGTVSLNGLDSVRLSAQMGDATGRFPDAAIHF